MAFCQTGCSLETNSRTVLDIGFDDIHKSSQESVDKQGQKSGRKLLPAPRDATM